ncbi:MAG: hypothetical protein ABSA83_03915 [Verrucomicrobiota bacterium]|jgi:hypothetical protein
MKKFAMFAFIGGVAVLAPGVARGCACGCGVFDVGTSSMFPHGAGGMVFVNYDFQDQDQNWSNTGPAPAQDNGDRQIRTDFTTYGLQYMFNRSWGVQAEIPYDFRDFKTLGGPTGNQVVSLKWSSLGDVRLEGIYTGFSDDMSGGLTFGVKLPTGNYSHNDDYGDIDRDSEIGTGSTDVLLGGFHRHRLTSDGSFTWFAQALLDVPVLTQAQYRPGVELDAAAGIYYRGWTFHGVTITPLAQVLGSIRTSDSGNYSSGGIYDVNDNPPNDPVGGRSSGYQRVLLSPGIEFSIHRVSVYADVELPVFQDFVGNQLVAPFLFKMYVSYMF